MEDDSNPLCAEGWFEGEEDEWERVEREVKTVGKHAEVD